MAKENKTVTSSTKEEAVMYLLLMLGVAAIVSLFAVNVLLIDKIMDNTILENQYLRETLEMRRQTADSDVEVEEDDILNPSTEIESPGIEKTDEADLPLGPEDDEDFEDFSDLEDGSDEEDTDLIE